MIGSITLISAIIILSSGIIIIGYAEQKAANTTTAIAAIAANSTYRPLVSTRGNFDINTSLLLANHNETDYAAFDIPGLQVGKCPGEIAIYVHGWGASQYKFLLYLYNIYQMHI
jgi:hypothetical protein